MIDIVEPPVVVVVGRSAIRGEVFTRSSCVVDVRNELRAHLVTGLQENVDSVIVLDELRNAGGERIRFSFQFIDPVILIEGKLLKGLSSP